MDDILYQLHQAYPGRRLRCARIVTFRVSRDLDTMITIAARKAGKSKSEFIRESVAEFIKFLEDNLGVEVDLQRYTSEPGRDGRRLNEFVVLV